MKHYTYEYLREVIYAVDYRGKNDDELYLLFRGLDKESIASSLSLLVPSNGHGVAKGMVLTTVEDPFRNGMSTRRVEVKVVEPNTHFCSLVDLCLLVEARLTADYRISISKVDITEFLNS